jgi:copper ion binding protein
VDTLQLTVNGMTCGGCENAVRRAVGKLEGVESVTADHHTGLVGVNFDPDQVTASAIKEEIEAIGYTIAP